MRSSRILLVQLISRIDIWTHKYAVKCAFFIQQLSSHSAVFVLPLSLRKTACYLALIFQVPCCQDCDSFSTQAGWQLGGILLSSVYLGALVCVRACAHTGTNRQKFPFEAANELVGGPTCTSPVRCSRTPAIGRCRRWLFLRLRRDRLTLEKTPRGRLRSRLALRKSSCSDGMESKVPGSTSCISLYSKYRYLWKEEPKAC